MPPKKYLQAAAAHARAARNGLTVNTSRTGSRDQSPSDNSSRPSSPIYVDSDEECGYEGGVNCSDESSDEDYTPDFNLGDLSENDSELSDIDEGFFEELAKELELLEKPTAFEALSVPRSNQQWNKIQKNRSLGYTGTSARSQRRMDLKAREQAESHKTAKIS